jgi:hypothetical protein
MIIVVVFIFILSIEKNEQLKNHAYLIFFITGVTLKGVIRPYFNALKISSYYWFYLIKLI